MGVAVSNDCPHEWGEWEYVTVVVLDTTTGVTTRPSRWERRCEHCGARLMVFIEDKDEGEEAA